MQTNTKNQLADMGLLWRVYVGLCVAAGKVLDTLWRLVEIFV